MTAYAIHLADLQGWTNHLPMMCLLRPVLDNEPFNLDSGIFAGVGLRLNCDEERAEAIWKVIRQQFKRADMRMYRSGTGKGAWKAI